MFRQYRLPLEFEALVVVGEQYYLKPLFPLFNGDGQFYLLALSQNEIRLFQGTAYEVAEIDLKDLPESLADALRFDDPEKQLQLHTGGPGKGGEQAATFHGHGAGAEDEKEKERLRRYLQKVDNGVKALLTNQKAPLVLAGVDYLLSMYREENSYPHLVEGSISGNPESLSGPDLHSRALQLVEPIFLQARQAATEQYEQLTGTERISHDVKQIILAAHYGQVETLFLTRDEQIWGKFDPDSGTVDIDQTKQPGQEALLDNAARQTFLKGGSVYIVEPETMPDKGSLAAAIFRY
jgi:hypothetical protein